MNYNHLALKQNNPAPEESGRGFAERREHVMETTETLVKTMESILAEREASQAKEKEAVGSLNAVLQRMGYQIVPLHQDSRHRRQGRGRAAEAAHLAPGPETQGATAPRRRGRPPKDKPLDDGIPS